MCLLSFWKYKVFEYKVLDKYIFTYSIQMLHQIQYIQLIKNYDHF
jgi:hypothetical protein